MTASPSGLKDLHPSSPTHDTMLLWLLRKNNYKKVIQKIIKRDDNLSRKPKDDGPCYSGWTLCTMAACPKKRDTHYHGIKKTYRYQSQKEPQPRIEVEKPIYDNNGFLLGVIDYYMDISTRFIYEVTSWRVITSSVDSKTNEPVDPSKTEERDEQKNRECIPGRRFELLIEIKPKLNNISATLGQMKVYRKAFGSNLVKSVLLTLDDQSKFDKLLKNEGIEVHRIPKQEIELA